MSGRTSHSASFLLDPIALELQVLGLVVGTLIVFFF
jgi:hypothetical protein